MPRGQLVRRFFRGGEAIAGRMCRAQSDERKWNSGGSRGGLGADWCEVDWNMTILAKQPKLFVEDVCLDKRKWKIVYFSKNFNFNFSFRSMMARCSNFTVVPVVISNKILSISIY